MGDPRDPDKQPVETRSTDPSVRGATEADLTRVAAEWRRQLREGEQRQEQGPDADNEYIPPNLRHDPALAAEWRRHSRGSKERRRRATEEARKHEAELEEFAEPFRRALSGLSWGCFTSLALPALLVVLAAACVRRTRG